MKTVTIKNLDALRDFARNLAGGLRGGETIGLVGDLGAGKTTFVQLLAEELGVKEAVKSPTFILMQAFPTSAAAAKRGAARICHVDAYRLKDWKELAAIGFEEYAGDPRTVTLVEWADRVPELHRIAGYGEITFAFKKGDSRELILDGVVLGRK
ncbi:MAG TPA: tRNA (adenosine(37)-N6)-threonylcarbamoyltransferase complex ATPase subunit type 1 TsaE [Patescibacteria group bacterium]|nr:tRNA (adenosine(37)-N6)-threonylcarbamoyltransferase complex ATPase subunit type 1 TsaE [Patescibacteria group bacterium]